MVVCGTGRYSRPHPDTPKGGGRAPGGNEQSEAACTHSLPKCTAGAIAPIHSYISGCVGSHGLGLCSGCHGHCTGLHGAWEHRIDPGKKQALAEQGQREGHAICWCVWFWWGCCEALSEAETSAGGTAFVEGP